MRDHLPVYLATSGAEFVLKLPPKSSPPSPATSETLDPRVANRSAKAVFRCPIELWHGVLEAQEVHDNAGRLEAARHLRDAMPSLARALRPTLHRLSRTCRAEQSLVRAVAAPAGVTPLDQLDPRGRFLRRTTPCVRGALSSAMPPEVRQSAACVKRGGSFTLTAVPQLDAVRVEEWLLQPNGWLPHQVSFGQPALHVEQISHARNLLLQLGPTLRYLDLSDTPVADLCRRTTNSTLVHDISLSLRTPDWQAFERHSLDVRRVGRLFGNMQSLHTLRLRGPRIHPGVLAALPFERMALATLDITGSEIVDLRLLRLPRRARIAHLVALDLPNCYEGQLAPFLACWPDGLGSLTISGPNLFAEAPQLVDALPPEVQVDQAEDVLHYTFRPPSTAA